MNKPLEQAEIEYIIARVIQNANDSVTDARQTPCEFNSGRRQAYYEVLDTIKNELLVREQNLQDYGYEKDWEKNLI